jgi:hypothetical protein
VRFDFGQLHYRQSVEVLSGAEINGLGGGCSSTCVTISESFLWLLSLAPKKVTSSVNLESEQKGYLRNIRYYPTSGTDGYVGSF